MNRGGFSWKRLLGITKVKRNISRKTGIPWTRSGRNQKIGRLMTKGCCSGQLVLILLTMLSLVILFIKII